MFWMGILCAVLFIIILVLAYRAALMNRAMDELRRQMDEKMNTDTNTLLSVSGGRHFRRLAAALNVQLRQLRRQRQHLQNGNRELKDAITGVSHDLRTPLTAIMGYLDLLDGEEKSEAAARYVSHIRNRADALRLLTEELFQYTVFSSQAETAPREAVCLNSALEESVAAFYSAFKERGIIPQISLPENEIIRVLDKAALSRVLGNVLGNALKYSGGDLEISLSASGELTVSNSAPELDEVQVGMLFNRFYTVETASHSTGLGLSISRTLMEQMGGRIDARYAAGRLSIIIAFAA